MTRSDDVEEVLATGRGDTRHLFVSLSSRDPDGHDAEYLRWHALDHRPEQHRLDGLRGSLRLVSTPECRVARRHVDGALDATDHVMTYLFSSLDALGPFMGLGAALRRGGRMEHRLPSVGLDAADVHSRISAPSTLVGADVLPWRPWPGAYVLVEVGAAAPVDELVAVDGVAGVWSAATTSEDLTATVWPARVVPEAERTYTFCFVDGDPVDVAGRLDPVVEDRTRSGATCLLAGPFHTVPAHEWDHHLP